ncbi:hypothetical protein [Pullulanibacillus pueri]|uniref:Uncharacterized protein n=1 Tax=Pullulanibacillus pueri TaxID=1437324 RepID=A0A8J2ZX54_9BACL|nr:hypothetical protein [Pullulanibacillus pueri]GGH84581.1 hypothetical protein GCM10007096_27990 [Pullulanibacillus pueri]
MNRDQEILENLKQLPLDKEIPEKTHLRIKKMLETVGTTEENENLRVRKLPTFPSASKIWLAAVACLIIVLPLIFFTMQNKEATNGISGDSALDRGFQSYMRSFDYHEGDYSVLTEHVKGNDGLIIYEDKKQEEPEAYWMAFFKKEHNQWNWAGGTSCADGWSSNPNQPDLWCGSLQGSHFSKVLIGGNSTTPNKEVNLLRIKDNKIIWYYLDYDHYKDISILAKKDDGAKLWVKLLSSQKPVDAKDHYFTSDERKKE